ncbi:hypothetical protein KOI35_44430 [Actinoplanes bogorensis]|uniref:Uncharacterized protein n=1 Tax=Paractinoplanes bogorensis TaxID=1610840 RepID=A0ABS5Z4G3_9ACTN|nr:hypothetical protein [Actinoplanes bogorensis]MBU2670570.1 hypothetical protein [Actinoplanes bogorensis]
MEFAAGPPNKWVVTLRSGAVLELAADSYNEENGNAEFHILADATADEQEILEIVSRGAGGRRVIVLVARIPMAEVGSIAGGWAWNDTGQDV